MLGGGSQQGGVAYAAHVGGFVAGLVLVKVFTLGRGESFA
jgi:rhomboid family protein